MMLYMNSEVFLDEFVEYESDKTILKKFYWSIVDLQSCVTFRCTGKVN